MKHRAHYNLSIFQYNKYLNIKNVNFGFISIVYVLFIQ